MDLLGSKIFSMKAIYINCFILLLAGCGKNETTSNCKEGNAQTGTTVCGLNGSGFLDQTCTEGQWVDSETCVDPDVCTNDETQAGTTVCGLNDSGFIEQICLEGQWVDSETCDDPDICTNETTQAGTTVCGLNGTGLVDQICTEGQWVDSETCDDPDICTNETTQSGTTVCGLNGTGLVDQICTEGQWVDSETCDDPDICTNETTQAGTTVCGLNGTGLVDQICTEGQWVDSETCDDPDICTNDTTQAGTTVCGLNGTGLVDQICTEGQWVDSETCDDPDICTNDTTQAGTTVCGLNGTGLVDQICTEGQWVDSETCDDPDICTNETTQAGTTTCGLNGTGLVDQICTEGQWVDSETCDDPDICVNGEVVDMSCGIGDIGSNTQSCVDGQWVDVSECLGEPVYGYLKAYGSQTWLIETTDLSEITISVEGYEVSSMGYGYGSLSENYIDVYAPDGSEVVLDNPTTYISDVYVDGQWTQEYIIEPYVLTPDQIGQYTIINRSYLNNSGGFQLEVKKDEYVIPVFLEEQIPEPSETPLAFFEPGTPTEEWTISQNGDLDLSKKTETWSFEGLEGQNVKIDMEIVAPYVDNGVYGYVDSYLYLYDEAGNLITSDDDTGSGNNSRIYHTLESDGNYRIVATTYGDYSERNWGVNLSNQDASWDLGENGIAYYTLSVEAKTTFDYVLDPLPRNNPTAIPINAIVLYDDQTLTSDPLLTEAELLDLISDLNTDFETLYSLENWSGFELASITKFYEPNYFVTGSPHQALGEIGNMPVALSGHLNLIILNIDSDQTGIVGTTNLNGSLSTPRGASMVLNYEAGSGVLIHEMGHVIGVQHLAGSWPPIQMSLNLLDGETFGYSTFDHSCPERSHMSAWNGTSYRSEWYNKSWYLSKGENTLNTPTHGRLFQEALRTWLINNEIIDDTAPETGYLGFDEGEGNADDFWTWSTTETLDHGSEHVVFPIAETAASNAVVSWQNASSNEVSVRYRDIDGLWQPTQSFSVNEGSDLVRAKEMATSSSGHAAVVWEGWYSSFIELTSYDTDTGTWEDPFMVVSPNSVGLAHQVSMQMNDLGDLALVWVSQDTSNGAPYQVLLRERSMLGIWSDTQIIYEGTDLVAYPDLDLNDNGSIFVAWQQLSNDVFTTNATWRENASMDWIDVMQLSDGITQAGLVQVALDDFGNAVATWRQADSLGEETLSAHIEARSFTAPDTLGSIYQLSPMGEDAFHTTLEARRKNIVLSNDGNAAVAWHGFDGEDYRIYVSQRAPDLTWTVPSAISNLGQHAKVPSLTMGENGSYAVSWQRSNGHDWIIQASIWDPANSIWSVPVSISETGNTAFWSTLSWDGSGEYSAFWARQDGQYYRLEQREAVVSP